MTTIESKKVTVKASAEDCYKFLSNMNNYELLLPKNRISEWKSDEKSCSFKIEKIYTLELVYVGGEEFSKIQIKGGEKAPFKMDIEAHLAGDDSETEAQLKCEADINPFMKMMIVKPLNNLFDYMAERLSKVYESGENIA